MGRDVIVTVLLIALAAVGSRAVFTRLEGQLPNVTLRAAIAGVLATFFLLHVVLPRGSDLVVFGLCLVYGWLVAGELAAGRLLQLPPEPPTVRTPPSRTHDRRAPARCRRCLKPDGVGKIIYATEADAMRSVRGAQSRRAAGRPAPDLRRAYYEERCGNWHVTSLDA